MAISGHKSLLIERLTDVMTELNGNLNFTQFRQKLVQDMEKAREYDELFEKERKLSKQVKELAQAIQEEQDQYSKDCDEAQKDIARLRKQVNELDVETKLHI